jgi:hypothetical protein
MIKMAFSPVIGWKNAKRSAERRPDFGVGHDGRWRSCEEAAAGPDEGFGHLSPVVMTGLAWML